MMNKTDEKPDVRFIIKGGSSTGKRITNKLAVMNQWDYAQNWLNAREPSFFAENMEFVEWMQFMTATGGSEKRDLFRDPLDFDTLDDYDFSPLVTACENVLRQGIKPFIKTGNIPLKYSSHKPEAGVFGVNIYEPKDFDVYHAYIAALASALTDKFGRDEVGSWKWGVFTEYENSDWFNCGGADASCEAYCKIYDYTVDALQSVLGEDIYIGAHSMTCSNGLWDERLFIKHCASGKNYCTGKRGARLCYLSSSFYDITPNKAASPDMLESVNILKAAAAENGLNNLDFGVDEGRLLNGCDDLPLTSRVVGHTYQAGYDARTLKLMVDNDIAYFATWCYLTSNAFDGLKTVSHQVASCFYKMTGAALTEYSRLGESRDGEVENDILTAYNEAENKFYIMAYSFKRDMSYNGEVKAAFDVELPMFGERVKITLRKVDDDSNFFDEWYDPSVENKTGWSVDSAQIILPFDEKKYARYAVLKPESGYAEKDDGVLKLETTLKGNAVVFYVIENDG